ncbi:hypothetical protein U1Q18_017953 [Sarracenia purpurea var. burkii]
MVHPRNPSSPTTKWPAVLLLKLAVMESVFFAGVLSDDQAGIPATSLLCISDCANCPVICSPPLPPLKSKPPPPPVHHSPPQPYYFQPPSSPPPLPPLPPPSYYIPWGPNSPPPPPGYVTIPAAPNMGQRNYTYPYYYFYASRAVSLSPPLLIVMLAIVIIMLDCLLGR